MYTNLARAGTASQVDTLLGYIAWKAIDGIHNGYRAVSLTHTETTGPGAWWKVELLAESYIDHIVIYNREDSSMVIRTIIN